MRWLTKEFFVSNLTACLAYAYLFVRGVRHTLTPLIIFFLEGAEVDRVIFRKAGEGSMSNKEMSALNDKHLNRIIEYLRSIGWTEEKILAFIQYVTE